MYIIRLQQLYSVAVLRLLLSLRILLLLLRPHYSSVSERFFKDFLSYLRDQFSRSPCYFPCHEDIQATKASLFPLRRHSTFYTFSVPVFQLCRVLSPIPLSRPAFRRSLPAFFSGTLYYYYYYYYYAQSPKARHQCRTPTCCRSHRSQTGQEVIEVGQIFR
jgi:hypothetical protein